MPGAAPGQFGDYSGLAAVGRGLSDVGSAFAAYGRSRKKRDEALFSAKLRRDTVFYLSKKEKDPNFWELVDETESPEELAASLRDDAAFMPSLKARIQSGNPLTEEQESQLRDTFSEFAIRSKAQRTGMRRATDLSNTFGGMVSDIASATDPNLFTASVANLATTVFGKNGLLSTATSTQEVNFIQGKVAEAYSLGIDTVFRNNWGSKEDFTKNTDILLATLPKEEGVLRQNLVAQRDSLLSKFRTELSVTEMNQARSAIRAGQALDKHLLSKASDKQAEYLAQDLQAVKDTTSVKNALRENVQALTAVANGSADLDAMLPLDYLPKENQSSYRQEVKNFANDRRNALTSQGIEGLLEGSLLWEQFKVNNPIVDNDGNLVPENVEKQRSYLTSEAKRLASDLEVPILLGVGELTSALTSTDLNPKQKAASVSVFQELNKGAYGADVLAHMLRVSSSLPAKQREALKLAAPAAFIAMFMGAESTDYQAYLAAQQERTEDPSPLARKAAEQALNAFLAEDSTALALSRSFRATGGDVFEESVWKSIRNYLLNSSNVAGDYSTENIQKTAKRFLSNNFLLVGDEESLNITAVPIRGLLNGELVEEMSLSQSFWRWLQGDYRQRSSEEQAKFGQRTEETLFALAGGIDHLTDQTPFSDPGGQWASLARLGDGFSPSHWTGNDASRYIKSLKDAGAITGPTSGARWADAVNIATPSIFSSLSPKTQKLYQDQQNSKDLAEANRQVFFDTDENGQRLGGFAVVTGADGKSYWTAVIRDKSQNGSISSGATEVVDKEGKPIFRLPVDEAIRIGYQTWRNENSRGFWQRMFGMKTVVFADPLSFGGSRVRTYFETAEITPEDIVHITDYMTEEERKAYEEKVKKTKSTWAEEPLPGALPGIYY